MKELFLKIFAFIAICTVVLFGTSLLIVLFGSSDSHDGIGESITSDDDYSHPAYANRAGYVSDIVVRSKLPERYCHLESDIGDSSLMEQSAVNEAKKQYSDMERKLRNG